MKKLLYLIISCTLACCLFLGACSCSDPALLSFTSAHTNEKAVAPGYKEKCEYAVTFSAEDTLIPKQLDVSSADMKVEFTDGVYTTELELLSQLPNDIATLTDLDDLPTDKTVYKYVTELNLKVNYTIGSAETKVNQDIIKTTCYFFGKDFSYAPIYVKTESATTNLFFASSYSATSLYQLDYVTVYTQKEIITTGKKNEITTNGEFPEDINKKYEYTPRTVIDNAQYLFLLRNMPNAETSYLDVVSLAYEEPTNLIIEKESTLSTAVNFTYNGLLATSVDTNKHKYCVADNKTSGADQFVFIQSSAVGDMPNLAVITKYAQPVIEYNSVSIIGALNYELKAVTVNG